MLFSALTSELALIQSMTPEEKLHYATTRMMECEEVWSVGNEDGWTIHDLQGQSCITIWPYRQFAEEYCSTLAEDAEPLATSIEQFVYTILSACDEQAIELEIMATADNVGRRISAGDLYQLLNGMLETGEYVLEG